jgi:hypothetical protein
MNIRFFVNALTKTKLKKNWKCSFVFVFFFNFVKKNYAPTHRFFCFIHES